MEIDKIGVVGCGTMGSGIVLCGLNAGVPTVVREVSDAALKDGVRRVEAFFDAGIRKGKTTEAQKKERLGLLQGTTRLEDLKDCDFVVEAVFEDLKVKQETFRNLDRVARKDAIFVSNTSTLSVTAIAACSGRADRVVGMHFCNPAALMKLVEVARGLQTSDDTYKGALALAAKLGKTAVTTQDTPGFLVNWFFVPWINDCIRILEEGIAAPKDIDRAVKLGLGYPLGPFELLDIIGMDIHRAVSLSLYEQTKDVRFAPPPLVQRMVDAGWLGKKTGKGFYEYTERGIFGS